jgi:uncharacterized repeat protein (TIGR02543 family)
MARNQVSLSKQSTPAAPRTSIARVGRVFAVLSLLLAMVMGTPFHVRAATTIIFTAEELLGKPTDRSITVNIVPASTIEYHYQYGTTSGSYTVQTTTVTATGGQPSESVISGLNPSTKYYYRMRYHLPGETDWVERSEHSFWTQRAAGSTFTFTVTSDSHAQLNTSHQNAMTNILNELPDFDVDLGDTFYPATGTTTQLAVNNAYLAYRDPLYMDRIGHSVPIFLSSGNHEEEEGWNLDDTPFSIGVGSIQARKAYFPTPTDQGPGGFYSGNTDPLARIDEAAYGDEYREDYYAWEWGDALFVVIDPFQYTMNLPYTPAAGEGSDDTKTGDQWNWTLGQQQYNWLKETLEDSDAKYKFVFSHQMLGGIPKGPIAGAEAGYVRGGAEAAGYFEWGGKNASGVDEFGTKRPGWDMTIQEMFVAYGVSAYFHGHDHQYVYETRDGVVYQEVPSPSMSGLGFDGIYYEGTYADYATVRRLASPGHLRVTIGPAQATVDYISASSTSGTVNYTYNISPNTPTVTHNLTVNVSPSGAGTTSPSGTTAVAEGSVVAVTAAANAGWAFDHWSDACTGSGACSVTMDSDKTVTANFVAAPTHALTTAVNPSGGGTITPAAGPHTYNAGAVVNVTAAANSGFAFTGWSGACTGSGTCQVTMDADKTVTANFTAVTTITFTGTELLGRPEATSISVKVVPNAAISLYYEYGTVPGVYTGRTATTTAAAGEAKTVVIGCLAPNTRYYYRLQYSADGGTSWVARPELSFWTQRAPGSTFTFDITTDSHINILLGNQSNWTSTMNGVVADAPDFLIDLGDTFAMDSGQNPGAPTYGSVPIGDTATAEQRYKNTLPTFNKVSGSAPIFLTPGNHEQQEAWHLTASNVSGNPANSLPVMGKNAEKKYFLNPVPDAFYSGDTSTYSYLSPDQDKQDYYAWTWGDALFVVISPFWTTTTKPYTTSTGGGEGDTTGTDNRWLWTLGLDQFNWLRTTLQNSTAKYKLVFSHQILGGNSASGQVNYGHGGVDSANLVEWGGNNVTGGASGWATNRNVSQWGDQPIRQIMEANHVTAFFHGHDHQMAYESLNGMVYQSVPSGSFTGSFGIYTTGGNSGNTIWADSTQGAGHLRVTVSPSQTTVDFIRYNAAAPNYTPAYSYAMSPQLDPGQHNLTVTVDGDGATSPAAGSHTYTTGSVIGVTATSGAGYVFDHWSGACTGSGACSITMSTDKAVTAHFTASVHVAISKPSGYPKLDWTHEATGVDHYAIYRSTTDPYFTPGSGSWQANVPAATPAYPDSLADLTKTENGHMYFYSVGPVNGCGGACGSSNRTGAFVYDLTPGD